MSGGNGGGATLPGAGGGGAAAGPAIFVNAGNGASAVGGGGFPIAGTADATPVFNFAGTVIGSPTIGPIPGALSNTTPQSVLRRTR